ncbi:MAG: hypothetical protein HC828_03670 [Blastochloris sp.]|nr:hypothetical protein [Blastochloris sp.]
MMSIDQYRAALRRLDLAYGVGLLTWRDYSRLLANLVAEHGVTARAALLAPRTNYRLN